MYNVCITIDEMKINLKEIYEISVKYKSDIQTNEGCNNEVLMLKRVQKEIIEILTNFYKGDIMRKCQNGELGLSECFDKMYSKELKDNPYFTFED